MLDSMDTSSLQVMYNQQIERYDASTRHLYDVIEATATCVRRKYAKPHASLVVTTGYLSNFD